MSTPPTDTVSPSRFPGFWKQAGLTLLIAAGFFAAGHVGLQIALPPGHTALMWPPAGVALAAVLILGRRAVPGVLLGAILFNGMVLFNSDGLDGMTVVVAGSLALGAGATIQPLVAVALMRRFNRDTTPFSSLAGIGRTIAAIGGACLTSASIGTTTLIAVGLVSSTEALHAWGLWWLGDVVGILLVAPIIVALERKALVTSLLLTFLAVVGVGAAYFASSTIRTETETVWENNADTEARRLSVTLVQWIETTLTPLHALAAVFENARNSDDAFWNAVTRLEDNERDFSPSAMAVAVPVKLGETESWEILYTTQDTGRLAIGSDIGQDPTVRRAVLAALETQGQTVIGAVERGADSAAWLIPAIATGGGGKRYVIIGLINLEQMIDGLFKTQVPEGMALRLTARTGNQEAQAGKVLHGTTEALQGRILTKTIRSIAGTAKLGFDWDVTARFQNGGRSKLAEIVLAIGVFATTLLSLLVNYYARQNEEIRLLIEKRTAELSEKEAQFRLTLDNMPGGIVYTDKDLNIIVSNHLIADMAGIPHEYLSPGRNYTDAFHHAASIGHFGSKNVEKSVAAAIESVRNPPGTAVDVQALAGRVFSVLRTKVANGGVISVYTDVTERKQAEERYKQAERRLRAFTEAVPDQMLVFDEDGTYVDIINPKNDLLSRSREELIGTHLTDYFTPEKAQFFVDGIQKSVALNEAIKVEYQITEGGDDLWLEGSIAPIQTDAGSKKLVMFISRDITQRRNAEQEVGRAHSMITESLTYASRIQRSLLPPRAMLDEVLTDHALFSEPKDAVGGDMIWIRPIRNGTYLVMADCTGHGAPGAFMTMISTGALDQALAEMHEPDPADLIRRMNINIKAALSQDRKEGESDDGVELGVCFLAADNSRIVFAGARFSLAIVQGGALNEVRGDRNAIGYRHVPLEATFSNHTIAVEAGMKYYMWTDGLVDQVGGPKRLSFGKRRLTGVILENCDAAMAQQAAQVREALVAYQQDEVRRDDITFFGFVPHRRT